MKPQTIQKLSQTFILALLLSLLIPILLLPIEDSVTVIVGLTCAGIGVGAIFLVRDPNERRVLLLIFCAAFGLRVAFICLVYSLDIIRVLGGEDDTGWTVGWDMSRYWRGWLGNIPTMKGVPGQGALPETMWDLFDRSRQSNLGYHFLMAKVFFFLDVRSQMAIALLNGFVNAVTACAIYGAARVFFSQRASLVAAGTAVILPGYLAWSALTVKETWVIFLEFATFYCIVKWRKSGHSIYAIMIPIFIAWAYTMRFYVSYMLVPATIMTYFVLVSKRPFRTLGIGLGSGAVALGLGIGFGVLPFDPVAIVTEQLTQFQGFRDAISTPSTRYATNSGVQLDYDLNTPGGLFMMILVGATYLLLSPFPWQVVSGRQILSLPDVLLWWTLVFVYIIPGIRYSYRHYPQVLAASLAYSLPLILLYSLLFGNVGLAYRQRAQIMPFLLILAAAGAEERLRRKAGMKEPALKSGGATLQNAQALRRVLEQLPAARATSPRGRA